MLKSDNKICKNKKKAVTERGREIDRENNICETHVNGMSFFFFWLDPGIWARKSFCLRHSRRNATKR